MVLCGLLGACEAPDEEPALPERVVEGEHVDYYTWADDSAWCVDSLVSAMDAYVGEVADALEVAAPEQVIRYVWVPAPLRSPDTWMCDRGDLSIGCYDLFDRGGMIHGGGYFMRHELVHAVSVPALDPGSRVLEEGLAEYMSSSLDTEAVRAEFPEAFRAMVERGPLPDDYRLAMHFVGHLLERWGLDEYKRLRTRLEWDASYEELAAAFGEVYGEDLDEVLVEMERTAIVGRGPRACSGDEEELVWEGQDLEVVLTGACGEPDFVGPGRVEGQPEFFKDFVVEVPAAGIYEAYLDAGDVPPESAQVSLGGCPGVASGYLSGRAGGGGVALLGAGRHLLQASFPPNVERRGEMTLIVRYLSPPPA
jgi:hypothetical protein